MSNVFSSRKYEFLETNLEIDDATNATWGFLDYSYRVPHSNRSQIQSWCQNHLKKPSKLLFFSWRPRQRESPLCIAGQVYLVISF